jgi:hypothetical protein
MHFPAILQSHAALQPPSLRRGNLPEIECDRVRSGSSSDNLARRTPSIGSDGWVCCPLALAPGSLSKERSSLRRHQAGDGVTDSVRSATGHGGECDA